MKDGQALPCGKCLPCLQSRARVWTHRIMLEAAQWSDNAFVSLTYEDQALTFVGDRPTLNYPDVQLFLKRLRKAYEPNRFRFYLSGEYGDETERPHYHAAFFNFPTCARGRTRRRFGFGDRPIWRGCCAACELVGETWKLGDVDLGVLETSSAQYVAGYILKKMTHRQDFRLFGRDPEFSQMSRQPGVGLSALHEVASEMLKFNLDITESDVPVTLRHGSRQLPLGRYARRKLREYIGKEANAPQETLEIQKEKLRPLREAAFNASRSFKKAVQEDQAGQLARYYAKSKIFKRRTKL